MNLMQKLKEDKSLSHVIFAESLSMKNDKIKTVALFFNKI